MTSEPARRNLDRYRALVVTSHLHPWLPVEYLFLVDRFGLGRALTAGAVYYLTVVAAELPTGHLGDRVGRIAVLRLAALSWLLSHLVIVGASHVYAAVLVAQAVRAVGFASLSGADISLHQDSLEVLGRDDELERREADARRAGFAALAVSSVVGGITAMADLRLPFLLGAAGAVGMLVATRGLADIRASQACTFRWGATVRRLRTPFFSAALVAVVAQVVLVHLVSEISQPWLETVVGSGRAPVVAAVVFTVSAMLGAALAGAAPALRTRLGLRGALLTLTILQAVPVVALALTRSPLAIPMLALRSGTAAAGMVLITAAVAPAVPTTERGTVLSLLSLGGRLAYGLILLGLSGTQGLDSLLRWATLAAVIATCAQAASGHRLRPTHGAESGRTPLPAIDHIPGLPMTTARGADDDVEVDESARPAGDPSRIDPSGSLHGARDQRIRGRFLPLQQEHAAESR